MRNRVRALATAYRRNRYACLFASLLVTLGAGATLDVLFPRYNPLELLVALNLIAAIASMAYEEKVRAPFVLAAGFVLTRGVLSAVGVPGMFTFGEALWIIAMLMVLVAAVRHALRSGVVDRERIFAALDAYLLGGLLFGVAYRILDHLWPGSFGEKPLGLARSIYFSFVTIATLGYGDVTPASEPAQGLAILEGVSGQLYLTVLVARLVSLYAQQRES